ncbi:MULTISPECIES: protein kinase domain-containing protein [Virgibacillus]|uniref:Protein kinase n=1 Tax=Virgibacillus dokdonensis TaxID=302167 RepID=A0A2K9IYB1_9BACI|nr:MULTISPECIES: protein kinase [Virgibacillus]AUJ24445.1 Serine/threonine-protein kinase Pkn1 [Virgibacillus dokdonensis]NWO12897.1 protein kinase [Virgibacillus sp.]
MKMNSQEWKKLDNDIRPGIKLRGKWHGKTYLIQRKLGAGAIGVVYLCVSNGKQAALKISDKRSSMTVEVNVLRSLAKVQGNRLGPSLLDVDDWASPQGICYSFYVMEYLHGEPLISYVQRRGQAWIGVFMLQLLDALQELHQSGWVFGDLKADNLLVVSSPPKVRWVDVGGTTQIGRSIKEYTEFYDRGYWGLGTRKAEASYDLFAFTMVFLHVYYPNQFAKESSPQKQLFRKIDSVKELAPYRMVLKKALVGNYHTSKQMKNDLLKIIYTTERKNMRAHQQHGQQTNSSSLFIDIGGISALAIIYYAVSLLFQ